MRTYSPKKKPTDGDNAMSRYNMGSTHTPDDLLNAILLRADFHIVFDRPKSVFVSKSSSHPEYTQLVIYLLKASVEL